MSRTEERRKDLQKCGEFLAKHIRDSADELTEARKRIATLERERDELEAENKQLKQSNEAMQCCQGDESHSCGDCLDCLRRERDEVLQNCVMFKVQADEAREKALAHGCDAIDLRKKVERLEAALARRDGAMGAIRRFALGNKAIIKIVDDVIGKGDPEGELIDAWIDALEDNE